MLLCDYFYSFNLYKYSMANYPGTKLVGVVFELKKKVKNSPSCVHVLHKTLNLEDSKEMYQNLRRTIVFPHVLHKTLNLVTSRCFAEDRKYQNVPKFKTHDCFSSLMFCCRCLRSLFDFWQAVVFDGEQEAYQAVMSGKVSFICKSANLIGSFIVCHSSIVIQHVQ